MEVVGVVLGGVHPIGSWEDALGVSGSVLPTLRLAPDLEDSGLLPIQIENQADLIGVVSKVADVVFLAQVDGSFLVVRDITETNSQDDGVNQKVKNSHYN